jgi:PilZ domain
MMADGAERREARRFAMSLPMRILAHDGHSHEVHGSTRDVSYRGLYFLAESTFEVGSEIDFVLTLPQRVSPSGEVDIRCRGQVIRVETGDNGSVGVAAKIERYEFVPTTAANAA